MTAPDSATGATDEQIEAAALRMHGIRTQPKKVPHGGWPCAMCHGQADAWAPHFVPSGTVIADASRVITDAEIEAVRSLWQSCRRNVLIDGSPEHDRVKWLLARLAGAGEVQKT